MRAGRDPTRRNRNIGTAKSGHGRDNTFVIPDGVPEDRAFYERLHDPVVVRRTVWSQELRFFVEPTRSGYAHACTVDDVVRMLELIPTEHRWRVDNLILRQPTAKQATLAPVWGRLVYWANLGRYSGTSIYLEAQRPEQPITWPAKLSLDATRELERLREDGHGVERTRNRHVIRPTLESTRATQLFRTLPHEIGHNWDYIRSVEQRTHTCADPNEAERIREAYRRKPSGEREAFAHRYADELRSKLLAEDRIPFPRVLNATSLTRDGLRHAWFEAD